MATRQKESASPEDRIRALSRQLDDLRLTVQELSLELQGEKARVAQLRGERDRERRALARLREEAATQEQLVRQGMLLKRDAEVARKLQRGLEPMWLTDFDGAAFEMRHVFGRRPGGDFYDVVKLSDNCFAILIADVSGCGLPAAVIMATARMAFRTFSVNEVSPLPILRRVNKALLESTLAGHHLTAFLGVIDSELLTLQYVNASHCSPYLIRGDEAMPLDTEGLFVGMFDDPKYEQKVVELDQGDKLFLYTDGLLSQLEEQGEKKPDDFLRGFLEENASLSVREMVRWFSTKVLAEPEDDVAILAVEILGIKSRTKTIIIDSMPSQVTHIESAVLPLLSVRGYGERQIFAIRLALEEAVINAIKHGNELDPTKKVKVDFTIGEDDIQISVADEGSGFDVETVPDPTALQNLEADSGRGIALMRAYMDEVVFNDTGNQVTMRKYAPWSSR